MKLSSIVIFILSLYVFIYALSFSEEIEPPQIKHDGIDYPLFPQTFDKIPELPSPLTTKDGTEIVLCITNDIKYTLIPVNVENGGPLNYKNNQWYGKGRQLKVDSSDFPTLAATGLHSETELNQTKSITGKSISEITRIGRPEEYSGAGFMSYNEDIISVLKGDNKLVDKLGMTHPQIAKPLFHVFNVILALKKDSDRGNIKAMFYNGNKIKLEFRGAKGWQESIFNDEILGYWQIETWRALDKEEKTFLSEKYPNLNEEQMAELEKKLSYIHTGEMVPYYIMRYGFYEGHTSYRADPIAIAFIFGLKSIEEIEKACEGRLYKTLMTHFTKGNMSD
jgi:hypothetical protein